MLLELQFFFFFFFNDTATTEIYTLSLHDALPIYSRRLSMKSTMRVYWLTPVVLMAAVLMNSPGLADRKSTRLNSSHLVISYAVFCLKKKKKVETYVHGKILSVIYSSKCIVDVSET